jgi:uncharacterized protein YigA (DUF484 family)
MVSEQASRALPDEEVLAFLRAQPDFFERYPELLEQLSMPLKPTGSKKVLDFQSYAVSALQENVQSLKEQFSGLLGSARYNMSAQAQVHQAVLHLMRARGLEELLQTLTQDFMQYFDVDAVRLVLESELAELYESHYGELNYSGISFVPLQTVDLALGAYQPAAMVADTHTDPPYGFEAIFIDCAQLIGSCALLRFYLPRIDRFGILAFGVREKNHFHTQLGVELLRFLSDAVALRLDQCLSEQEIEALR